MAGSGQKLAQHLVSLSDDCSCCLVSQLGGEWWVSFSSLEHVKRAMRSALLSFQKDGPIDASDSIVGYVGGRELFCPNDYPWPQEDNSGMRYLFFLYLDNMNVGLGVRVLNVYQYFDDVSEVYVVPASEKTLGSIIESADVGAWSIIATDSEEGEMADLVKDPTKIEASRFVSKIGGFMPWQDMLDFHCLVQMREAPVGFDFGGRSLLIGVDEDGTYRCELV